MTKPIYTLVKIHRIIESCVTTDQLINTSNWLVKYFSEKMPLTDAYEIKKALINKRTELRKRHEALCNKVGNRY